MGQTAPKKAGLHGVGFCLGLQQKCPFLQKITKKGTAKQTRVIAVSSIRTIPSALEFHQISTTKIAVVVGYTTGGELHPALKQAFLIFLLIYLLKFMSLFLLYAINL